MMPRELTPSVLSRGAVVYVRQSTGGQVLENRESQRRQYALGDLARAYGFQEVRVIDDDLGRSASGTVERPGFRSLVGQVCEGVVGAVFCLEASRLARNGRDWHHLLELCGLVGTYVIDTDGAYDPSAPNDRLLLGLKGTMSEFELTLLRKRLLEAALAKARRGELRVPVPIGYVWSADLGLMMDPDRRIQEAVRGIFRLFERLGSARQVLLHMRREGLTAPRPLDGRHTTPVAWRAPVYRTVLAVLQNPFYAGAYAYGKSQTRTTIIDGTVRKAHGRRRPMNTWTALVRDHHEAYISWEHFEHNQQRLARNAFGNPRAARRRAGAATRCSRVSCGVGAVGGCFMSPTAVEVAATRPSLGIPAASGMRCTASHAASRRGRGGRTPPSRARFCLRCRRSPWTLPSWPNERRGNIATSAGGRWSSSASKPSTMSPSPRGATRRSIRTIGSSPLSSRPGGTRL
jgi:DNA invertase Pin-like site-specific DNA recombinase